MSVQDAKNKIIGLTGGIATGKSTVSAYLREKGYQVLDSDEIVHHLWKTNQKMIKTVVKTFDLDADQNIVDQLRTFVFNDKENVETLNSIVHPYVFEAIDMVIKSLEYQIIFIDMPLLFEVGYQSECDQTWLVYIPQSVQIKRLMKRDKMKLKEAIKRISLQMDIEEKKMLADNILDNRGSKKKLYQQIDQLLDEVSHEK